MQQTVMFLHTLLRVAARVYFRDVCAVHEMLGVMQGRFVWDEAIGNSGVWGKPWWRVIRSRNMVCCFFF